MRQIERVMSLWKPPMGVNTSTNSSCTEPVTIHIAHHGTTFSLLFVVMKQFFSHLMGNWPDLLPSSNKKNKQKQNRYVLYVHGLCKYYAVAYPGFSPRKSLPKVLLFFAEKCIKIKEFGPQGGRASLAPPLDPPMLYQVNFYRIWYQSDLTNFFFQTKKSLTDLPKKTPQFCT